MMKNILLYTIASAGVFFVAMQTVKAESVRNSILQTYIAPYLEAQECENKVQSASEELASVESQLESAQEALLPSQSSIDAAATLINNEAIPDASAIDTSIATIFGFTPTTIDSTVSDPLDVRIQNGLLPYLQAALANLGDYNKIIKIVANGDFSNGGHLVALTDAGKVYVTGLNESGELGVGDFDERLVLTPMLGEGLFGVDDIAAGPYNTFVLKGGVLYGTGYNFYGELGIGLSGDINGAQYEYVTTLTAALGEGASGVDKVVSGGYHTLILKGDKVYGVGNSFNGELGINAAIQTISTFTAMAGEGASGCTDIAAGEFHSVILKDTGAVYACGIGDDGRLGIGVTPSTVLVPTAMIGAGTSGVAAVAAAGEFSVVLKDDGSVWGTGRNQYGQLGIGSDYATTSTLVRMLDEGASDVDAVACGWANTVILKGDKAYAVGDNYYGSLGIGTDSSTGDDLRYTVTAMAGQGMSGVVGIAAGDGSFIAVLKNDHTVYATGWNGEGELGDGTTENRNVLTLTPSKYLPLVP